MNKFVIFLKIFISCYLLLQQAPETSSQRSARIVGGEPTTINSAPFLIQFLDDGECICGGTLISEYFAITAAHCVENRPIRRLSIKAGAAKISETGIRSNISKVMVPTTYNNKSADTDVAVLKLVTPVKGRSIKPIQLCKTNLKDGHPMLIFGWGLNEESGEVYPDQVHTVQLNVFNKAKCQKMLPLRTLTDAMFCAAAPKKDACIGDSGGPAIVNGELCGIISWGNGCGRSDAPGVYTDIRVVSPFIINSMKQ